MGNETVVVLLYCIVSFLQERICIRSCVWRNDQHICAHFIHIFFNGFSWLLIIWNVQSEINFLGRLSHPNLVKLLGYCWEDAELLLVYEFMQKGSLENHLFRSKMDGWMDGCFR